VIVVGSVNVDLVVAADRLPAPGETVTGGSFEQHHGGKGGNQAVAAARLGAPTVFVGAVGDDTFGGEAADALRAEGIDLNELLRRPGTATGLALIVVDRQGENLIAVASGANGTLTPADVAAALGRIGPTPADVIVAGCEIPLPAVRETLRLAHSAGATSILNPAPATGLDRSVFGLADLLTPNRPELAELATAEARRLGSRAGPPGPEAAARSLLVRNAEGDGVRRAVLVSMGAAGAILVTADGASIELPAAPVEAVDTVGAGDALNGALAVGLAAGQTPEHAARMAIRAASLAVTRRGAREGMPTRADLDAAGLDAAGLAGAS
jgi:ribokinase